MEQLKKIKPHLITILLFVTISFTYFSPLIQGKMLDMPDIKHYLGASKEVRDFRDTTGEEALWTNSMFSGMPAYQISTKSNNNLMQYVVKVITLGMPRPASTLFLCLLGFYILLLSLKVDYRLSAVGAIAFAFSSYFFIIIQAGHMTKAHAIVYVPMVVASVLYTYRGKMLLGGVLTALAVALEIYANHLQITYYLLLILIIIGLVEFVKSLKANKLLDFAKRTGVLLIAALLASGTSFSRLSTTLEYGKDSTRGKSELTNNMENKTSGLDKDYATDWSYGIAETFTLLIPNFYGGSSSNTVLSEDESETLDFLKRSRNPQLANALAKYKTSSYWGEQPFTSGPTYSGSIVIFLFVLGLFFIKSEMRAWLILATILSVMLAWGKNFMPLSEFFLDYFPGYNKFRAVSTTLVIAVFTLPLLGFLGLNEFLTNNALTNEKKKPLLLSFYIVGGLSLLFSLIPSLFFDFLSEKDLTLTPIAEGKTPDGFLNGLASDREGFLSADAWRSFIFISLTFGTLWFFIKNQLRLKYVILIIGLLVLADMWTINKRYLNDQHFVRKSKVEKPYIATDADKIIYKAEGFDSNNYPQNPHFRVFNQSVKTFNDASTSYFHKSIGGYHGAKLKRYQELIERHIQKIDSLENKKGNKIPYYTHNVDVLSMLNAKWIIKNNSPNLIQRTGYYMPEVATDGIEFINTPTGYVSYKKPCGNAWFVNTINLVENADMEIAALNKFNPYNTAIVDERFRDHLLDKLDNTGDSLKLIEYKPNYLQYESTSKQDGIAIFSEIYYDKGWNAYIDGKLTPHFRANYVLRGMQIPAGDHIIEFKFEPSSFKKGENVALASSIILLLLLGFVSFKELKK